MGGFLRGTPSLFVARLVVCRQASGFDHDLSIMVLDIAYAFIYATVIRTFYIELQEGQGAQRWESWTGLCAESGTLFKLGWKN